MKKTNKFILGAALTSGVIACFGSAFALYKKLGNDVSIGIGSVKSHTDSSDVVTYKIGTPTVYKNSALGTDDVIDLATAKLSPELNKLYVKVPLSFEYGTNLTTSAQDTAVGHLNVKVDIDSAIAAKGTTVTANLTGYKKENDTADTYFTKSKMDNFFATADYSTLTAGADGFVSQSGYIDTAVDASSISCLITIDMSSALTDDNFLGLAEITKAFNVTINWSPYQTEAYATGESWTDAKLAPTAFVRGDRSDWQTMEDYRMVPNINAAKSKTVENGTEYLVEWKYTLLKDFSTIKVYDSSETVLKDDAGWIYCRAGTYNAAGTPVDVSGGNAKLDKNSSYNVYYVRDQVYNADYNQQGFYVEWKSTTTTGE